MTSLNFKKNQRGICLFGKRSEDTPRRRWADNISRVVGLLGFERTWTVQATDKVE